MNNKIAIIVTWFGELPPYFKAWLKSAEKNTTIDFFCFFDHDFETKSNNIFLIKSTMQDEINRISKAINEKITINNSYKFCDLRPSFGLGYADYLKDYQFWGYCDIDLVFGDIRTFLTDEVLDKYDRFYEYGHLSIFRNNDVMNNLYNYPGCIYSKNEIFRKPAKCTPEEHWGINRIMEINNFKCYRESDYADFYLPYQTLLINNGKNYDKQIFYWEDGKAIMAYEDNNTIQKRELVYIHWQKRKPVIEFDIDKVNNFFITSERLIEKNEGLPNIEDIQKYNPSLTLEKKKEDDKRYFKKKIKEFFNNPLSQKLIWIKQKIYFVTKNKKIIGSKM